MTTVTCRSSKCSLRGQYSKVSALTGPSISGHHCNAMPNALNELYFLLLLMVPLSKESMASYSLIADAD